MTATVNFEEETITISLEEYKQLLEYKGRYLELKETQVVTPSWTPGKITWNGTDITCKEPEHYHYTCGCRHDN